MTYVCDLCGKDVDIGRTRKLLGKRYCPDCISIARSKRKKALASSDVKREEQKEKERERRREEKKARREEAREKRRKDAEQHSIESIRRKVMENGAMSLSMPNVPLRLKRREQLYFLVGDRSEGAFYISVALTNSRLFLVGTKKALRRYDGKEDAIYMLPGVRALNLGAIIAIDEPSSDEEITEWHLAIHLDKGKDVSIKFHECWDARLFYVVLAEMVDRLNDPIDESALSPKRERIPEDVKIAVWRRDGGACASCGSRTSLEYDHIVPVARGGSNTVRNIELLCESCNRKKSDKIG